MKIEITYSRKEMDACVNVARTIGAEHEHVMNGINNFEVGGKNLKVSHKSYDNNLTIEINDEIVSRFIRKLEPIIDMIKGLIKITFNAIKDLEEDFNDVKIVNCYSIEHANDSKFNKENKGE